MMIVVRDVFRLEFGKAREAKEILGPMRARAARDGYGPSRMMFDLVGPYYTVVMESVHESLSGWEQSLSRTMDDQEWRELYAKFTPLVESGYREIFTVME